MSWESRILSGEGGGRQSGSVFDRIFLRYFFVFSVEGYIQYERGVLRVPRWLDVSTAGGEGEGRRGGESCGDLKGKKLIG